MRRATRHSLRHKCSKRDCNLAQPSATARFFGYAMIAVGVLITLLSGGCTLVGLFIGLTEKGSSGLIGTALIFGLPFVAIGIGLVVGGRTLSRSRGPTEPPGEVF